MLSKVRPRVHHHRSHGTTQLEHWTENKPQQIRNIAQDRDSISQKPKHRKSTSTQSSCKLQVVDSEDDVYLAEHFFWKIFFFLVKYYEKIKYECNYIKSMGIYSVRLNLF